MFFFLFLKFNNGNFSSFFFVGLCYFCLWQIFSLYFLSFPPSKPVLHRALAVLLAQPFFFSNPFWTSCGQWTMFHGKYRTDSVLMEFTSHFQAAHFSH